MINTQNYTPTYLIFNFATNYTYLKKYNSFVLLRKQAYSITIDIFLQKHYNKHMKGV